MLNRPERIERLAQKYLKLAPAKPLQLVTVDSVSDRDFDRSRVEEPKPVPVGRSAEARDNRQRPWPACPTPWRSPAPWPEAKVVRPVEASAQ